jgi:hypothetical protein
VKVARCTLQNIITWTKKSQKGRQKWEKPCVEKKAVVSKLKTLVKIRFVNEVIMLTLHSNLKRFLSYDMGNKRQLLCNKNILKLRHG